MYKNNLPLEKINLPYKLEKSKGWLGVYGPSENKNSISHWKSDFLKNQNNIKFWEIDFALKLIKSWFFFIFLYHRELKVVISQL